MQDAMHSYHHDICYAVQENVRRKVGTSIISSYRSFSSEIVDVWTHHFSDGKVGWLTASAKSD